MSTANCIGWGAVFESHSHPDRFALRPPHKGGGEKNTLVSTNSRIQIRQAECIAAMPPVMLRNFTWDNPAFSIIFANAACGGKRRMLSAR